MTEIDGPSSVLLNASEEPALVAFDGLFEDPGLIELLDFTIDFDPARKADVGEVDAVGLGDAEQLVLELLDVGLVGLSAAFAQLVRDGSEDLGGREVGDLDHVARIPGLLHLAVLFERRLEEGLAVKVVGRDVAHAVILSGTACELVHHATGAGAGSSRGRFVRNELYCLRQLNFDRRQSYI